MFGMSSSSNFGDVKSNPRNSSVNCVSGSESDSSIENNDQINQNEEDSDSDAQIIVGNNKIESKKVIELPNRNGNLPSSSQFCHPYQHENTIPAINSITLENSDHPMFGNKTFYKGKITINNYVSEDNSQTKCGKTETQQHEGNDNANSSTNIADMFDQRENGMVQILPILTVVIDLYLENI